VAALPIRMLDGAGRWQVLDRYIQPEPVPLAERVK
jgi:hypothetical protein